MNLSPRYRLVRTIASGGMAQVLEAVLIGDSGFERQVAIKRILPEVAHDERMQRMFLDEAKVCSQLHHGNIVQVVDYGMIDGSEFIAMEFVEGADARRACGHGVTSQHPIPPGVALHIISQVAHALHYAHTLSDANGQPLQVVHRDISPHNVLLSWSGDVKLADFGIALAMNRQEQTRTGIVKGKLDYMAPEQALAQRVTPAADVYALGPTLHSMICGQPPEGSGEQERKFDPNLDPRLRELIERWMARDPQERPTATEVAASTTMLASSLFEGADPRTALSKWLAPLRPRLTHRSHLDELMGLALFADGDRCFTVSRETAAADGSRLKSTATTHEDHLASKEGEKPAFPRTDAPASTTMRIRPRSIWLIASVLLVAAAFMTWLALSRQPDTVKPIATPPVSHPSGLGPKIQRDSAPQAEAVNATPGPVRTDAASLATLARPSRHKAKRSRRGASGSRKRVSTKRKTNALSTKQHGWLRVGGLSLARSRVEINGSYRGYAPLELKLPIGNHSIVVRDSDTHRPILKKRIVIEDHHTRANPHKLIR